ncbi:L-glutamine ABC transporter membrane protein /L-glutamate ABC transporter membrane protein /L-aspartate ABC transporter membrane protein /L-asparagine ABC transporter membrane protein [Hasllibacter halocynthiae]|uniref:L-glutamine ABC transporter membrane protein /L-glutamate ABC transporter membrane protein /L-aspartate ABC transporter membrane protein /L-asparagine ABC transporter membrane protein n=1 Tax=Hasllibacter halocynthiae TaxID=595589 RepID=A0A2T0X3N5_9RHOB|nr:amino acid ABC transporter permease [Hasllibacter halocynthiae]PRY93515.1 L-glutamine ABC transporter membrane protein /L-glutamate ABC transporter membrane protein /L-aspartate ABC transporter membrane protein /L-asparagine ABC transporter membrane protein [Hasllibacter halocynthiae]
MSDTHAQTAAFQASFVREEMVAASPPPARDRGVVKWLRENLFSSWLNVILTVLGLLAIWWIASHVFPWMLRGIWVADSLSECREIRNERYGEGVGAACWAVLTERWNQLMFGFYPQDLYWRPVAGVAFFVAALMPILFSRLPRWTLWFSAAAPFVAFWLIWGGTIWAPVVVAGGFALGALAYVALSNVNQIAATLAAIVVPVLFWLFAAGPLIGALQSAIPLAIEFVPSDDIGGFLLAVIIGFSAIILSLPLGILLALGRRSDLFIISKVSVAFIETIRGVPLIVWLFTASLLLNYFMPPGTNFDLMLRVIIMVTLFASAYIAEVVRGGLAALPKGQYEGADSLGLDYWQSMRLVILPQALKISIPGIVNTFIGLFKDTTLVVFIGLLDPIGLSNAIRATTAWNGIYWELFIFIGLLFFVCCFAMSRYSMYLERKLAREHR